MSAVTLDDVQADIWNLWHLLAMTRRSDARNAS